MRVLALSLCLQDQVSWPNVCWVLKFLGWVHVRCTAVALLNLSDCHVAGLTSMSKMKGGQYVVELYINANGSVHKFGSLGLLTS